MTRGGISGGWPLGLILVVAILVRLPPLVGATLSYDDGVEALMSQDVLRGRFPVFFYGQPAHGAADRYPAALVTWLLGPTVLAAKLAPVALFLLLLGSMTWTTGRIFGRGPALVAAGFLAVPPYYLFGWSFDPRGHYPLMLILGTWTLYLGWLLLAEGLGRSPGRRFVGLGLLVGLAWWTNYLAVTYLAPLGLALGLASLRELRRHGRTRWRPLLGRAGLTVAGVGLGALPLLVYQAASRPPGVLRGLAAPAEVRGYLRDLAVDALPQVLGAHPEVWGVAQPVAYALALLLALGMLLHAIRWVARADRPGPERVVVAWLLGVVLLTLGLSTLTGYGSILRYPRYLLPLYLALPPLAGLALTRLAGASPALAVAVGTVVAMSNVSGGLVLGPVLMPPEAADKARFWRASMPAQLALLDQLAIDRVYGGTHAWSYLSDRRVLAADPARERMIELAWAVDAAPRIAWALRPPTEPLEQSLSAAGIRFRRVDGLGFVFLTDFALAAGAHVDLDPAGWSAQASESSAEAGLAFDRHVLTMWRATGGEPSVYQVDLGDVRPVGLVSWLPGAPGEAPRGFRVALSVDGQAWRQVAHVPEYVGPLYWSGAHPFARPRRARIEVRFPASEARHVRIEHVRPPVPTAWSIAELFVATPAAACAQVDVGAVTRALTGAGVRFVYADHWTSAALHVMSHGSIGVLPSNRTIDAQGLAGPLPGTVEPLRPRPGRALVIEACPDDLARQAERLLETSGVRFTRRVVGGYVVFHDLRPPAHGVKAARWTVGSAPGAIEVVLERSGSTARLLVQCRGPAALGIGQETLGLETSADGQRFESRSFRLVWPGVVRVHGSRLFRDPAAAFLLEFEPRALRALRVTARDGWRACPVAGVSVGGER